MEKEGMQPFNGFVTASKGHRKVSWQKGENTKNEEMRISKRKEFMAMSHNADVLSSKLNTRKRL